MTTFINMAKTRGGGSQLKGQTRPTTSVRRRDRGGSSSCSWCSYCWFGWRIS